MPTTVKDLLAAANAVVPRISADETQALLANGKAFVVDVRDAPEVAATGRIPGAIHVSRGLIEFKADTSLPSHDKNFDPNKIAILYCASGGRSALAGKVLRDLGYKDVRNLGSINDWTASGKPVERG